ncbi:hypothetical protein [Yoonia vestfoldensis]|uniref:hypothetical protein n=1 Tax=Yoonia vestfoldensis TaxID=245188 RepID=UPI000360E634|nr:hypothetical protein [Yoonia vestfoldensis]
MFHPDHTGGHATVHASEGRRYFACGVIYGLGGLLIYTALARPPDLFWLIFLLGFGGAMLWLGERLRRATRLGIVLTETDLRDTDGTVLARMEDIVLVDRGALAMKPANGFTLVLKTRQPRGWSPGMWWRIGKRVGVGGVTAAGPAKFMAEQIALRIKARDG